MIKTYGACFYCEKPEGIPDLVLACIESQKKTIEKFGGKKVGDTSWSVNLGYSIDDPMKQLCYVAYKIKVETN